MHWEDNKRENKWSREIFWKICVILKDKVFGKRFILGLPMMEFLNHNKENVLEITFQEQEID